MNLNFSKARQEDSDGLTHTAYRSKKHWNYPPQWMELWKEELSITPGYILQNEVIKVYCDDDFIGFFALVRREGKLELDHFWLLPGKIRKGHGRAIFKYILELARQMGFDKIRLSSDPFANGFYDKMGGRKIGKTKTQIEGRYLDLYEFNTTATL